MSRPSDRGADRYDAPAIGPVAFARWVWRQLTSMSTALLLLLLLALAAIPGSVIPQTKVDPSAVSRFRDRHPDLSPWFDRFDVFDVYSSVWFSAIYLLLMVSLIGCIVPRLMVYARALRAEPPRAPRNLERLAAHARWTTSDPPEAVAAEAERLLRRQRRRVVTYVEPTGAHVVAAEKGYLREAGNLLFHLALCVVLVGVALSSLFGFKGTVAVAEGQTFTNQLLSYDEFTPGARYSSADLEPFAMRLDRFDVSYKRHGTGRGVPTGFSAHVTVTQPDGSTSRDEIQVNHPLPVGGADVYLVANGYAPRVTVWDGRGRRVYSGPTMFIPQDAMNTSYGVIKAPDARPQQLGFEGFFFPTARVPHGMGQPMSVFPDDDNPVMTLIAYRGDLGLDSGAAQSVYVLDKAGLDRIDVGGKPLPLIMRPGDVKTLPHGLGRVRFDGLVRYARFQVNRAPADSVPLTGVVVAIIGLMGSLFVRPRRTWVRVGEDDGRTLVEVAALDRVSGSDPAVHVREVEATLKTEEDS